MWIPYLSLPAFSLSNWPASTVTSWCCPAAESSRSFSFDEPGGVKRCSRCIFNSADVPMVRWLCGDEQPRSRI